VVSRDIEGGQTRAKDANISTLPAGRNRYFIRAPALKCWATFALSLRDNSPATFVSSPDRAEKTSNTYAESAV
jgi:hypothetical protein